MELSLLAQVWWSSGTNWSLNKFILVVRRQVNGQDELTNKLII